MKKSLGKKGGGGLSKSENNASLLRNSQFADGRNACESQEGGGETDGDLKKIRSA